MQFSWHFCPKTCCQCVCVCVSVFACRLFELQYARGQQVILCGQVTCFTSLSPLHPLLSSVCPTLPLSCLLHLFPLLYLFGIFFALVSACLFLASVFLLLLHLAVFSFIWCRYLFTLSLFPSPLCQRPVVLAAAGNDFNLLLTSLKFRNCNGNTQHDFDPSIGAHNYSSSANGFGGRGDNSGCQSLQCLHKLKQLIRLGREGARKRDCL